MVKKNESKLKYVIDQSGKEERPEPFCPTCFSGLEPTISTIEYANALRDSI